MPSVLIVDDDLLAREGLRHMLGLAYRDLTFGEAPTAEEAAAHVARRFWDVAVIEASVLNGNGEPIVPVLRCHNPAVRIWILSQRANPEQSARARQLSAWGYTGKNSGRAALLKSFARILSGKESFEAESRVETHRQAAHGHAPLSIREREVLKACVSGKRIGEIATGLQLSVKTISTYKRRILNKLGLNSVAEMVRHTLDNGHL
jgi:two-component system, NarL family, invasion response regulator UvrY